VAKVLEVSVDDLIK